MINRGVTPTSPAGSGPLDVFQVANFGVSSLLRCTWISGFLSFRLDADPVVDRILKTLLTAQISLGRLGGDVAE